MLQRLQAVFHTKRNIAELLLAKLDHALRGWTTSGRNSSCVAIDDVYTELALDEDMISYNLDLIAVEPFFTSRDTFKVDSSLDVQVNRIFGERKSAGFKIVNEIGEKIASIDLRVRQNRFSSHYIS